jgi:hypothetical protein
MLSSGATCRGRDRMIVGLQLPICNQCLSPLKLWVRTPFRRGVLDATLCDKVCQWLDTGRWFSPGTPVSSTNKFDRHDITKTLLKVALNTINQWNQNQSTVVDRGTDPRYGYTKGYACVIYCFPLDTQH